MDLPMSGIVGPPSRTNVNDFEQWALSLKKRSKYASAFSAPASGFLKLPKSMLKDASNPVPFFRLRPVVPVTEQPLTTFVCDNPMQSVPSLVTLIEHLS